MKTKEHIMAINKETFGTQVGKFGKVWPTCYEFPTKKAIAMQEVGTSWKFKELNLRV